MLDAASLFKVLVQLEKRLLCAAMGLIKDISEVIKGPLELTKGGVSLPAASQSRGAAIVALLSGLRFCPRHNSCPRIRLFYRPCVLLSCPPHQLTRGELVTSRGL